MSDILTADGLFYTKGGLDRARTRLLVEEALAAADDGELYLEYRQAESLAFDDGRLKSASFDTAQGFGLRAVAGEATGYAHGTSLSEEALRQAGSTVRAALAGHDGVLAVAPPATNTALYASDNPLAAVPFAEKVAVLAAIDAYARGKDAARPPGLRLAGRRVAGGADRPAERGSRRRHPPARPAQRLDRRRAGRPAGDGQLRHRRPGRVRPVPPPRDLAGRGRRGPPAGAGEPGLGRHARRRDDRGPGARLARHPAARGHRPWAGGRLPPQADVGLRRAHRRARRRPGREHRRRRHPSLAPRLPQRRRRGDAVAADHADRGRHPRRPDPGPAEQPADGLGVHRQWPAAELRPQADAADDQHLHAGRRPRPGRDHRVGRPRPLRGGLRRRPGRHHVRQVRLLLHRGLQDRTGANRRAGEGSRHSSATGRAC